MCITDVLNTSFSAPDDSPQFTTVFSASPYSISLAWKEPLIPNGVIISYTVIYNETEINAIVVVNNTSYEVTNLEPFTYYEVHIYASTRIGDGPSKVTVVRTAEASEIHVLGARL